MDDSGLVRGADATLEVLWKRVLDHWDDETAHALFLDACQKGDRLVEAAVRYRGMAADRDRGPVAQKRLASVTALALTKLETSRTGWSAPRPQYGGIALIVLFVLATLILLSHLNGLI
jgi:hypothetical protein